MILSLSFSKYNIFLTCPLKYWYQYIIKPEIKRELSYALVLGQLVHLFVNLFYKENYSKNDIIKLKDKEDKLNDLLTKCSYLSFNFKNKRYEVTDTKFSSDIISFINENNIVYWHSVKLFNIYIDNVHKKIIRFNPNKILSEFTFNNIIKYKNNSICFYGSIDNIFILDNKKLIYISDIKTGKNYYDYYLEQLYFYYFNIMNYNIKINKKIYNNSDNINDIEAIKDKLCNKNFDSIGILFMIGYEEFDFHKKKLQQNNNNYKKYIENLFSNMEILFELSKTKKSTEEEIVERFNNYNYFKPKNKNKQISYKCKFCDFNNQNICNYRLKK